MTLKENILLGRKVSNKKFNSIIDFCNLNAINLEKNIGTENYNISAGETQRVGLARGLIGNPDILIMDESLSALDRNNFKEIEERLIDSFSGLVIHISHQNSNKKKYTKYIEIKNGGQIIFSDI